MVHNQQLFAHGQRSQEISLLENNADVLAAYPRAGLIIRAGQIKASDLHAARGRSDEASGDREQGGFSRARFTDDRGHLSGMRREVSFIQRGDGRLSIGVNHGGLGNL